MTADRALPENDQAAGENVRALHRDADRYRLIDAPHEVARPHADGAAALHDHGVIDDAAHAFGEVIFDDGRDHRRFLSEIDCAGGHGAGGVHHIGIARHARQRLFDAFETTNGSFELAADAGIAASGATSQLAGASAARRQRNRAAGGEALHQPAPALADAFLAADLPFHGEELIVGAS